MEGTFHEKKNDAVCGRDSDFCQHGTEYFAEEETGGIRKIADMVTEARRIKEGTEMFSASMTFGDMEVSAGMTIRMTPDSASVDMLYLSAPNGDGTFFDFVSEDVLRVFGTKAYLNTESVKRDDIGIDRGEPH